MFGKDKSRSLQKMLARTRFVSLRTDQRCCALSGGGTMCHGIKNARAVVSGVDQISILNWNLSLLSALIEGAIAGDA